MIKAVLLDLDNTLLTNPDRAFAYGFAQAFDDFAQQSGLSAAHFRQAIQHMSASRTADESNSHFLLRQMTLASGISEQETTNTLRAFFDDIYPNLARHIQPVTFAAELVMKLYQAGYAIVIATQPIYPLRAIQQRMAWAGLPQDNAIYALITSLETMHFSKPHPSYYAEILARVGVEPDEAIMVGDNPAADINPAHSIGLQTYHIDQRHTLQDFYQHLQHVASVPATVQLVPQMVLPQLMGNLGALYGLLDEVKPGFWHRRPDPNEWSIVQILCHLQISEESNERPRLNRILHEDNPFLIQPKPPGPDLPICNEDGYQVAACFRDSRMQTIHMLESLSDSQWQRPAKHSIFGLTNLLEMAYFTAQHDRLHINQLCQTIGRCRSN